MNKQGFHSSFETPVIAPSHGALNLRATRARLVRALVLDSQPDDVLKIEQELILHGYTPLLKRVDSLDAFEKAIESEAWDLIVSDSALAGFTVLDALSVLRETAKDIPLLVVATMITEDDAIAAMRAGANDCILKSNLRRLIPAMERELREFRDRDLGRQTAHLLEETEIQFRHLWVNALDGLLLIDKNSMVQFANPSAERIFGISTLNLSGKNLVKVESAELAFLKILPDRIELKLSNIDGTRIEVPYQKASGEQLWLEVWLQDVGPTEGFHSVLFLRNITQSHLAERQIEASEARYRLLADHVADVVSLHDHRGKILYISPSVRNLTGLAPEKYIGFPCTKFLSKVEFRKFIQTAFAPTEKGKRALVSWRGLTPDGSPREFESQISIVETPDGEKPRIVCSTRDATISQRARAELLNQKERLQQTLSSLGEGVITTDANGFVELVNTLAMQITAYSQEEMTGRPILDFFRLTDSKQSLEAVDLIAQMRERDRPLNLPKYHLFNDRIAVGLPVATTVTRIRTADGTLQGYVVDFRDLREQEKIEQELMRASTLESIGVLAGGIAHDFNNLLTSILGNLSLIKMDGVANPNQQEPLDAMESAVLRATDLTRQLLTFSKGGSPVRTTASISELARETASFSLHGSNITCQFHFPEELWSVNVDCGQISQVLNNLVINAQQAMPEGGTIEISAQNVDLRRVRIPASQNLVPGPYVELRVKDHGMGIDSTHLPKIFDPFFSTKKTGSGLGLATSYNILRNHQGHIAVVSNPGEGTEFLLYLPATPRKLGTEPVELREPVLGSGRVLVMDDEPAIRTLLRQMLSRFGYEVDDASEGTEAIGKYQQAMHENRPYAAVVMDLTIPGGMGGKQTIAALLEMDPGVRAIVASGYSSDPIMADFAAYGFKGMVAKPFRIQELCLTLERVIG